MATVPSGSGPTVRRVILGAQLRRLREAAGLSREEAGYPIRASASKISRLELGRVAIKKRDLVDLLTLYGVTEEHTRDSLLDLARQANAAGWWQEYSDVVPGWFQTYVGLEEAATRIRTYQVQFVPGLLQSEDYTRAVMIRGHPGASQQEVEQRVDLRMARRQLLTRQDAPHLWAVVDETALRRPMGSRRVMRAQIAHLQEMATRPNVTLQVLAFQAGVHAAEGGAFTILRFPEPDIADVVYVEQLTSALYLDKRGDVHRYTEVMNQLSVESEPPRATTEVLAKILREI